jgi:hypothetical protein
MHQAKKFARSLSCYAFLSISFASPCMAIEWLDKVPALYQGTWVETSDDIVAGLERPDVITIGPQSISALYVDEGGYGDEVQRKGARIIKVCQVDSWFGSDYIVIFSGTPNKDHIADSQLKMVLEEHGHFCSLYSQYPTSDPENPNLVYEGRYVRKK